jgi:glycosyltransferase involved in cell wall biosynthesis
VKNLGRTTSKPRVTIGIPTYNRAIKTLPATLQSALAQTYSNIELVVSDNCSTDDTENVVRRFGSRVHYIRQTENLGLNGNLNACVDRATGDYVLLLHDDDLIDPDFVESCMDAVDGSTSVGLIRTGVRIIQADETPLFERRNRATTSASMADLMLAWFRHDTSQYCCNTLYNTHALREIGGFHSRHNLFQDALAQVKVAAKYGHAHVGDDKASWRRHDRNAGSAARARLDHWCEDSLELMDEICALEPARATELRRQGMQYFCEINYLQVAQLASRAQLAGYMRVARCLGCARSPFSRLFNNELRPHLRSIKRPDLQRQSGQTA